MKLDEQIAQLSTTSLSDTVDYRELCALAAADDEIFARFRSYQAYRRILEHVDQRLGAAYLDAIRQVKPEMLGRTDFAYFGLNDEHGSPETFQYPGTDRRVSPTTLRYIFVMAELSRMFAPIGLPHKVVEVGGGYGGQARMLRGLGVNYTIVDLPEACALAKRYLSKFGLDAVFIDAFDEVATDSGTLFLSNYALTECAPTVVESYVKRFALNCERGYITGNAQRELIADLLAAKHPSFHPERPVPVDFRDNFVCTW